MRAGGPLVVVAHNYTASTILNGSWMSGHFQSTAHRVSASRHGGAYLPLESSQDSVVARWSKGQR